MKRLNREKWEQRVCPLGTWSFRARLGGNHAHTHARADAGAWSRARVRVPYPVRFFLNRVSRVCMGLQRIAPAPLSRPATAQQLTGNRRELLQRFGSFCLKRTLATIQIEPLQPFGRICPSRTAINSAPFLLFQNTTKQHRTNSFFCNSDSEVKIL